MKKQYADRWEMLFKLADLDEHMDKQLTPKKLSDPNHKVVKHIMYIYSMESFIYAELNRVCREKDKSKIKFYGAFAAALSFIIHSANQNRIEYKLEKTTTLFRGVKLAVAEVDQFQEGSTTNLLGYTSTSMDISTALEFALMYLKDDQTPVLFEITFKGSSGLFQLTQGFTAFPEENEVLVQDGLTYRVTENSE